MKKLLLTATVIAAIAVVAHAQQPAGAAIPFPNYNVTEGCQQHYPDSVSACIDWEYSSRSAAASVWAGLSPGLQRECLEAGDAEHSYEGMLACIKGHRVGNP
jgi:hypothetical protein